MKKSTLLTLMILMSNTAAMANVLHVTTGKDSVPGSLRSVISEAQSGDTIEIDENVTLLTLDDDEIVIHKSLSLQGTNKVSRPVVDAQNKSRIFMIHGSNLNVNISNINFTHGFSTKATLTDYPAGGAINILSEGSRIGITNADFYENKSSTHGGAIEATGPAAPRYSVLTLNHVTFHNNTAAGSGTALFQWGTSVKATDTVFEHNSGDGAAIWSATGCLDLNRVSVNDNEGVLQGSIHSSSFMKLVDVQVDRNRSDENHGAVVGGFILKLQNSQLQGLTSPFSLTSNGNNLIGEFTPSQNRPLSSVVFHTTDKVGNTEDTSSLNINVPRLPTYGPCVWEMMK
ncbi:hypothetical protein [Bdellovibrio bacteriovorus]|uniref:Adhesin-like protein n=1 Tax=Bdellovibrio bacteriovorus str. Tiberius TaxID=1069642 RepID=K7YMM6_BDEBC|nr:hypothetical protein [Bdellovibrio bacteriovorus]AFY01046.1 adhesin-like protein [Bdellovibrio bacteriovorus str. Tiberius]